MVCYISTLYIDLTDFGSMEYGVLTSNKIIIKRNKSILSHATEKTVRTLVYYKIQPHT